MSCAVEYPLFSKKMGMREEFTLMMSYVLPKKQSKVKPKMSTNSEVSDGTVIMSSVNLKSGDCITPITTTQNVEEKATPEKEIKKKKKWKSVPFDDLGFNMSLFPRPTRPEVICPEEEERIWAKIEKEIQNYEETVNKYPDFDTSGTDLFEGTCKMKDKLQRADRDRKIRKAGRQIKDKYCKSLRNNKGRRKLYIHHRIFKLITLEEKRLYCHLPSQSTYKESDIPSKNNKSSNETRSKLKPHTANSNDRPAPVQNLRFALQQSNAAPDLDTALVNVLINLQHRELTPEDYDLLLQLDNSVAPKTIDKKLLDNFKTDTVDDVSAGDICPVCMDAYEIGQCRKFLPCNHVFHAKCIDMWLEYSSRNCPVDGLPVDEVS